ncbi:DNA polymerase/3'-5' exonuclease PolX [Candidatus Woesearchaeota archaeon]|nr:DNA polymerase/3'-5' exonuclease PolX [Candidatus Woesearchaeota archaeon]
MLNSDLAKIFYEIADILEMQHVQWKPAAYRKAARAIESLPEDVADVFKKKGVEGLKEISGVGEGLAAKIVEYLTTKRIKEYDELKKKIPRHLSILIDIPGLGPKHAELLHKKLGINNIEDLKKAIAAHKLAKLSGFGAKSEENIAKGLELFAQGTARTLLGTALPIAEALIMQIKQVKGIGNIEVAGSVRRRKETIGDIDILVTAKDPKPIMERFTHLPDVKRIMAQGPTKSSILLKNNLQVDCRVLEEKSYGAALNYFTGSKEHNIVLREIAIKKGFKLSEYGLFNRKTNAFVAGRTEEEVYKKLGLPYIPPELRENAGEIEAARQGKLPVLVEEKDLKGDLHMHTTYSDGNNSTEEMIKAAIARGYEYIAITDHSPSVHIAHGMTEKRLVKQLAEIEKLQKKYKDITILAGSEVDILPNGSMDYSDKILKRLDWVIGSVHSAFKMPRDKMTRRICKAMENPYVRVIGHPSGRLMGKREPYDVDMKAVFQMAKKTGTFLEIDSQPPRLDLKDVHIRAAIDAGVTLVIDSDAHDVNQLRFISLGLMTARRGWATKKDIANCLPLDKFLKLKK